MAKFKKIFFIFSIFLIFAGVFISGVFLGLSNRPAIEKVSNLYNKEEQKPAEVDFSPFWIVWDKIDKKYVDADNAIDDQDRVYGAIQGLVNSFGDPYSVFLPPREKEMFESSINGEFSGVGMEIGLRDKLLTVIAPLKGTPAEKAGIKSGDKIIKIDETETFNITLNEAVRLIRGEQGTAVALRVVREGEEDILDIEIVRDVIKIPVLDTEVLDEGVFIIRLYNFSAGSTNAFRGALREFAFSGKDKLIIDLRGNPGGFLEASVDIASWFLPLGKIVAREQFADKKEILYRSKGYDIFNDLSLVILVNKGSASASEILAGALKEHGLATLVGEKTFGKGSVQEVIPITKDTSLKLTIAKWLTPNGLSISKEGLTPDFEVEITKEDIKKGRDPQLAKAIDLLIR